MPNTSLLEGTNILSMNVAGVNQSVATGRVKFEWSNGSSNSGAPVEKMVYGVAVNALNLPEGADPNDIKNFQIVLGPGPGFATRIYTAASLSCGAGLNSVQVLVLSRRTLDPDRIVAGNTDHPGQACFADAASLANFLKGLPTGDLVIANSFFGAMPNLNTTAIGGTDFSKKPGVTPLYYNVIGAVGAPAGQAYESYQPIHPGVAYISSLIGSLMLDTRQNYFFVPSEYRNLHVIPNDPAFPGTPTTTFLYPGAPYRQTLPAGARGGFVLFLIDRQKGYIQWFKLLPTNSSNPADSAAAYRDLLGALTSSSPEYMIILTTIGVPFSSPTQVITHFGRLSMRAEAMVT